MRKKIYFITLFITTISNLALAEEPAYFADVNLKMVVEEALGIIDPTPADMSLLTFLDAAHKGISDLTGLEYATNLQILDLTNNQISNLVPLSGLTSLVDLYLGRNHIVNNRMGFLSLLSKLTNLRCLVLNNNQIHDISALSYLTNLEELNLDYNQIIDISSLSKLTNLKELYISYNPINDISLISEFTSLTFLDLSGFQISDLSLLSGLTNLQVLYLEDNLISNISPLSGLTGLEGLYLENNRINDISSFSGLTNLRTLYLENNQINDISSLSSLTELRLLILEGNYINDISLLSQLKNLQGLYLENNQINDISSLSSLPDLYWLNLSENQISDISPLSCLTKLRTLYIRDNQISDISPISELFELSRLSLSHNQITDISALSGLINLQQELSLSSNQISDISPLSDLTNLIFLQLQYNQITDISPLSEFTNLERLYLMNNQVDDILAFSSLTNLEWLYLSENQISDISPLSELTNLEQLFLNSNQLSDISQLSGLTKLQRVRLDDNQISDISFLSELTNLRELYLWENPLGDDAYATHIPLIRSYGAQVSYDPPLWRTLTISSTDGGSVVEPGEGDFDYTNRTVVKVNAVADRGYEFVNWTGTAVDTAGGTKSGSSDIAVTMDAHYTLRANFRRIPSVLYVDDDAPNDLQVNNPQVSDPDEDGSFEHPYDTIQEAVNQVNDGDTVLVYPGRYREAINFLGKAITVQGQAASSGIPVLENPDGFAVSFIYGEGLDSVLRNFVIRNSFIAVFIAGSSPTISNVTIVSNKSGIEAYADSEPVITNSIFWGNTFRNLFQSQARYSCIEQEDAGESNINTDPLFVNPDNGDYHLRSERGRYWPQHDIWVIDEITSPCIDSGDPSVDTSNEPLPNGGRINMGAYGGTAYASMSESPL